MVKGVSPPWLDGVKGRLCGRGSGSLKHADIRRIQSGLGPACLRATLSCLLAQILAHSPVEFRVLPLAP